MNSERDELSDFREAFLDYLEGSRDSPPTLEILPAAQRGAARAFIKSIMAARGVDPYASRPSIRQLLTSRFQAIDRIGELARTLQDHLRQTVDPKALVSPDTASLALGLSSVSLIQARGMRIRVAPEADSADFDFALTRRATDFARIFSAFPDSHAVLYTTTGQGLRGVIVDRSDVYAAIETPSGERRAPRLQRSIVDAATACEEWLTGLIPDFEPLSTDLLGSTGAPESALNPHHLASTVVDEVSTAGGRARIEAKRVAWGGFGAPEAQRLAAIVQEAQHGQLSEAGYMSHIDELVGIAA